MGSSTQSGPSLAFSTAKTPAKWWSNYRDPDVSLPQSPQFGNSREVMAIKPPIRTSPRSVGRRPKRRCRGAEGFYPPLTLWSVGSSREIVKTSTEACRVSEGARVKLSRWATTAKLIYNSEAHFLKLLDEDVAKLSSLQQHLFSSGEYSLLLIFQAMDAGGKDGAITHLLTGVNPEGCEVHSFKQPSAEELNHDFLWRTTCRLPARGRIGVFNRSYYEEVLVVRVHPELLINQHLPPGLRRDNSIWKWRYRLIVDFEKHLHRNGVKVLKFFLHLSKNEQRKRFLARLDEPNKNWKFSVADINERRHWNQYVAAYEECLSATSTENTPWYVIPADDKKNARLIISDIVINALEGLDLNCPKPLLKQKAEMQAARANLCHEH